jgi:hypothetical protein
MLIADTATTVNLDGCIDVTGAEPAALIVAVSENNTLESLSVQNTLFDSVTMKELLDLVITSFTITNLNISHCPAVAEQVVWLAECIRSNTTLTCLSMRGIHFSVGGLNLLVEAFKQNHAIVKLRVDDDAREMLQAYAHFNEGMSRIASADVEDLNDLMFECIRLDTTHRLETLLNAGASAVASDTKTMRTPHSLLFERVSPPEPALLALFRRHWVIDQHVSNLLVSPEKQEVFERLTLALINEKWHCPTTGDNALHRVLMACLSNLISSEHAEELCKAVQEIQPNALQQPNNVGLSPVELATQCSRSLRMYFAAEVVAMVRGWTKVKLDGPATPRPGEQSTSPTRLNSSLFRGGDTVVGSKADRTQLLVKDLRQQMFALQEQVAHLSQTNRLLLFENAELLGASSAEKASSARRLFKANSDADESFEVGKADCAMSRTGASSSPLANPLSPDADAKSLELCRQDILLSGLPPIMAGLEDDFAQPAFVACAERDVNANVPHKSIHLREEEEEEEDEEVVAEEYEYEGVVYFLERSTGKVYQRDGENNFVGKLVALSNTINFNAVDSDDELSCSGNF